MYEQRSQPWTTLPQLQCRLDPADPRSPQADMAYRGKKLCLQYEGHIISPPSSRLLTKGATGSSRRGGWTVMLANRVDLQESFCGLVSRLAAVLAQ
ncbi:MAG: hypothetical protein ACTHV8_06520 [Nesterenkonia sp.]